MVVRDTFLAELKTLFGLVVAGFEPGFSDPKARALPLRQSYAVFVKIIAGFFFGANALESTQVKCRKIEFFAF